NWSGSALARTSCGPAAASSTSSGPSGGGGPAGARRSNNEDDLPQLAAGREAVVGGGRLVERKCLGQGHADQSRFEKREDVGLDSSADERLLLEGPGPKGRAGDDRPLVHDGVEVQLGTGPGSHADHDHPPAPGEGL